MANLTKGMRRFFGWFLLFCVIVFGYYFLPVWIRGLVGQSSSAGKLSVAPVPVSSPANISAPGAMPRGTGLAGIPGALAPTSPSKKSLPQEARTALAAFDMWAGKYRGAGAQISAAALAEGEALASVRRPIMQALMKSDPQQALASALRWDQYVALPDSVRNLVEQPFSEVAEWSVLPICNSSVDGPHGNIVSMVKKSGDTIQEWSVTPYGRRLGVSSKSSSGLQGIRLGTDAAVREDVFQPLSPLEYSAVRTIFPIANKDSQLSAVTNTPLPAEPVAALAGGKIYLFSDAGELAHAEETLQKAESLPGHLSGTSLLQSPLAASGASSPTLDLPEITAAAATASSTWTESPKTVLCIVVDFSDKPGAPVAMSDLTAMVSAVVKSNIEAFSFGKTTVVPTAAAQAVYRMPQPSTYYTSDYQIHAAAEALAKASGSDPANFNLSLVFFTSIGRGYAGLAQIGGPHVWIQAANDARVITHEFGHSYGVGHANYWDCNDGTVVGPNGTHVEYGDIYDVMGSGSSPTGHFNPRFKRYLNWLTTAQQTDITATTGTYRVYASDNSTSSSNPTLALRVKKDTSNTYIVGLKRAIDNTSLQNGLYILWDDNTGYSTRLLDMTPDSAASYNDRQDAALALNRTFTDPTGLVNITPVAKGGTGASAWMDVSVVLGVPGNHPPTISISGNSSAQARTPVAFTASASDPDGDTLYYSWDFGSGTAAGTATSSFKFPTAGNYTVTVTASDAKGGTVSANKTVSVTDPLATWSDVPTSLTNGSKGIYNKGRWLLSSYGGTFAFSPDGSSWKSWPGGSGSPAAIAYGAGRFVSASNSYNYTTSTYSGSIASSPDGQTWNSSLLPVSTEIRDLAFGNGLFIACLSDGSNLTSPDGIAWTRKTSALEGDSLRKIAFGAGVFLATSSASGIWRSTDGIVWARGASDAGIPTYLSSIVYEPQQGLFLAVNSGETFVSSDAGLTWISADVPNFSPSQLVAGAGFFAAVGSWYNYQTSSWNPTLYISGDGLNWGAVPITDGADAGLMVADGRLVRMNSSSSAIMVSGSVFACNTSPEATIQVPENPSARIAQTFSISPTDADGDSVSVVWDFGDGQPLQAGTPNASHTFQLGGNYTVRAYISDGRGATTAKSFDVVVTDPVMDWTPAPPTGGASPVLGIYRGGLSIIGQTNSSSLLVSPDCTNWKSVSLPSYGSVKAFAFGGGMYVMVHEVYANSQYIGRILTSNDAQMWTMASIPSTARVYGLAYGNGTFVATVADGSTLTSTDSVAWTQTTANLGTAYLRDVVFCNGFFVAAGSGGGLFRSADGKVWTQTGNQTGEVGNSYINKIGTMSARNRIVALGFETAYSSDDGGLTWVAAPTRSGFSPIAMDCGADFVASLASRYNSSTSTTDYFLLLSSDGFSWGVAPVTDGADDGILVANSRILRVGSGTPGNFRLSGAVVAPNAAPVASMGVSAGLSARTTNIFTASVSDADDDPFTVIWDFGDGSPFLSASTSTTHTYLSGGSFLAKIYAADGRGGLATAAQNVSVVDSFAPGTSPVSGTTAALKDAVWTGSQFVAVGNSGGTVLRSADGITWSKFAKGGNYYLYGICWTGSLLVAVGMDYDFTISSWIGTVLTSSDAITWTERLRGGKPLKDVACGTFGIVAVGDSGRAVFSSLSATVWTESTTGSANQLNNIVFNGSAFVIADGDLLRTSTTGETWTTLPAGSNAPSSPSKLLYASGKYYALSGSSVHSSTDAVSWSKMALPASFSCTTLTVGDGFIYVAGQEYVNSAYVQKDYISLDGVSWASIATASTSSRDASIYAQGRILTFGATGSIQRSGLYTSPTGYAYWTKDYFPAGGALSGAQADPDDDMIPNLMEYALGTHPSDSGSKIFPALEDHLTKLTLSAPRFAKRPDVIYMIEQSADLVNWSPTGITITSDTSTLLRGEIPVPAFGKAFLRLSISRPTGP